VLHGKLDLLQAEAIGDLVDATAPAQRRAALHQLDRGTSVRIAALRDRVLAIEALMSYDIDFPEEDDGPIRPERITAALVDAVDAIDGLLATAAEGARLRDGALCVIAGRPNAGKSSLFNALLGQDRAIVPTYRHHPDAIEAPAVFGGSVPTADTAGLRDGGDRIGGRHRGEPRVLGAADVVLYCARQARWSGRRVPRRRGAGAVVRTGDLARSHPDAKAISVSAQTGSGTRPGSVWPRVPRATSGSDAAPVLTERHRAALATRGVSSTPSARHGRPGSRRPWRRRTCAPRSRRSKA
jgi:tRNA modification GTPase